MVIPIVIGTFGTVPKDLKRRLENIGDQDRRASEKCYSEHGKDS